MKVDGREIPVHGRLLQPLRRRTSDQIRVAVSGLAVVAVVLVSYYTKGRWESLENSISDLIGVASPELSNRVYTLYGVAILALPFAILVGIVFGRRWKLLAGYAAAAILAGIALSITGDGIAAPQWNLDLRENRATFLSQFLDDSRWIAMLAAVLTVCGPWLPRRWRRLWWALLLAFIPIHLFVSAVVPARALLGLTVGWFVGALVVLFVGTPALEVPVDLALRVLGRRGRGVQELTVLSPAGPGPLVLAALMLPEEVEDEGRLLRLAVSRRRPIPDRFDGRKGSVSDVEAGFEFAARREDERPRPGRAQDGEFLHAASTSAEDTQRQLSLIHI